MDSDKPKLKKKLITAPLPLFDTIQQFNEQINLPNQKKSEQIFDLTDYETAIQFLKQYNGNQATFNCYRREVERVLHWSWLINKKSLLTLTRDNIEQYIKFCEHPPLTWIGTKKVARFINLAGLRQANPEWRPFVATTSKANFKIDNQIDINNFKLSQKALKEIFVVLGSFYNFAMQENKTNYNPVASIKQKSKYLTKQQSASPVRRLSEQQWQTVLTITNKLADDKPEKYERSLFVISALYFLYLRVSELAASKRWSPQMNHFHQDSYGNWWFTTVGKGNKQRNIAVNQAMLNALIRWRQYLNFSPKLPTPLDISPLLPKLKGFGNISDTKTIYQITQDCFDHTVNYFKNNHHLEDAENLATASAHWLRHTGISDDINKHGRPIAHVRDDAGHSSILTTDRYNDIVLLERHESAQEKQ